MTIPAETIEAGAKARSPHLWNGKLESALLRVTGRATFTPEQAAEIVEEKQREALMDAKVIITAAAPFIQAAALAPILALHKPVEISYFDGRDDEFSATCCDHCTLSHDDDSLVRWPCATARAAGVTP